MYNVTLNKIHTSLITLGITTFLLVMLSGITSAEDVQPSFDSITVTPSTPIAGQPISVTVHAVNAASHLIQYDILYVTPEYSPKETIIDRLDSTGTGVLYYPADIL